MLLVTPSVLVLALYGAALMTLFVYSVYEYQPGGQMNRRIFTTENFSQFLFDSLYIRYVILTMRITVIVTFLCLVAGYPIAYLIARTQSCALRTALLFVAILPFMTSVIVKVYAWMVMLGEAGLVNDVARLLGVVGAEEALPIGREWRVILGLTYHLMPVTILALIGPIRQVERSAEEAALNLGANEVATFFLVTLPLSLPGIIVGALLAFSLSLSAFVFPLMMGEGVVKMISQVVYDQILTVGNYPLGAAISLILLVATLLILAVQRRLLLAATHRVGQHARV